MDALPYSKYSDAQMLNTVTYMIENLTCQIVLNWSLKGCTRARKILK